jgi:hypothetical protein
LISPDPADAQALTEQEAYLHLLVVMQNLVVAALLFASLVGPLLHLFIVVELLLDLFEMFTCKSGAGGNKQCDQNQGEGAHGEAPVREGGCYQYRLAEGAGLRA